MSFHFHFLFVLSVIFVLTKAHDYIGKLPPHVSPGVYKGSVQEESNRRSVTEESEESEHDDEKHFWDDNDIDHEREHIEEHLHEDLPSIDTKSMSMEELKFHYFKLTDMDNNHILDGCELIKGIMHAWEHDHNQTMAKQQREAEPDAEPEPPKKPKVWSDLELITITDQILDEYDTNKDGLIDYAEYKAYADRHT